MTASEKREEATWKSLEKNMDGVIGPILQLSCFDHPIDLDYLTEAEAEAVLDYFGSIH